MTTSLHRPTKRTSLSPIVPPIVGRASARTVRARLTHIARHWQLYLLLLPPVAYILVFRYIPMYGIQLAFKDFNIGLGFAASPWVGVKHFANFFRSYNFSRLLGNTIGISMYQLAAGFLPPILLAIALNECLSRTYKKTVQLITYAPYFLSSVIIVGIIRQALSLNGVINNLVAAIGWERISYLGRAELFKSVYVWSGVWQATGYSAIIYLAALAGVSPELHEAAHIDGANIWQRIRHIDIPGIVPTAVILLILSTAGVLNVDFDKVFLLQNPLNMRSSDVISTFVYRVGLVNMNFSFATAVGLFQSVVSLVFMATVNKIAKQVGETSLW